MRICDSCLNYCTLGCYCFRLSKHRRGAKAYVIAISQVSTREIGKGDSDGENDGKKERRHGV